MWHYWCLLRTRMIVTAVAQIELINTDLFTKFKKSAKIKVVESHQRHPRGIERCLIRTLMTATAAARMEPMNTDCY